MIFKITETDNSEVKNYHNYIGSMTAMYRTSATNDSQFHIIQGEALVHSTLQG